MSDQEVKAFLNGQREFWAPASVKNPLDTFVRNGGFHGAWNNKDFWTFRPHNWDAPEILDGKGDPLPYYAIKSPFGWKGDLLYVKESTRIWPRPMSHDTILDYRADGTSKIVKSGGTVRIPNGTVSLGTPLMEFERDDGRWRSARTMPQAAARIWIRVKSLKLVKEGDQWLWLVAYDRVRKPKPFLTYLGRFSA